MWDKAGLQLLMGLHIKQRGVERTKMWNLTMRMVFAQLVPGWQAKGVSCKLNLESSEEPPFSNPIWAEHLVLVARVWST